VPLPTVLFSWFSRILAPPSFFNEHSRTSPSSRFGALIKYDFVDRLTKGYPFLMQNVLSLLSSRGRCRFFLLLYYSIGSSRRQKFRTYPDFPLDEPPPGTRPFRFNHSRAFDLFAVRCSKGEEQLLVMIHSCWFVNCASLEALPPRYVCYIKGLVRFVML